PSERPALRQKYGSRWLRGLATTFTELACLGRNDVSEPGSACGSNKARTFWMLDLVRLALLGARQEIADCGGDLVTVRFESDVAGVEEEHFSVRNVPFERLGARRQEKRVVLAPSCQKRRLVLAKIGLEFGIQRDVALVVAK